MNDRLVWIDCEMTGLDLVADALIEVAALVTDFDLNVLGDGIDLVIKPPAEALDADGRLRADDAREVRAARRARRRASPSREAEAQVLAYVSEHCADGSRPPLAGNTVATDRSFLTRDMPTLEAFLHYRIVDVSSIKELSRRWFPRAYFQAPAKRGNHRALADIQESIEELRYYREAVFVPPPAPTATRPRRSPPSTAASLTGLADDVAPMPRSSASRVRSTLLSGPGVAGAAWWV